MNGTVKQFYDTLEVMRKVYQFKDDKTKMQTRNLMHLEHDHVSLITQDEATGVWVEMSRDLVTEEELVKMGE